MKTFGELIEDIKKAIEQWNNNNKTKRRKAPKLPENLWMLKMLERMMEHERKKIHSPNKRFKG